MDKDSYKEYPELGSKTLSKASAAYADNGMVVQIPVTVVDFFLKNGVVARLRQVRPFFEQRVLELHRMRHRTHARENYERNLLLLHDVLAETELAGKYWLVGGLLLGWARDGALLEWDYWDADFCYLNKDRPAFQSVGKALRENGFQFKHHWSNNAGEQTQSVFMRDYAKFEFWETTRKGDCFEDFVYGTLDGVLCQGRCLNPVFELAPVSFLGRVWQKPADHEMVLTAVFGDWRVPKPDWNYLREQCNIVELVPWYGRWSNEFDDLMST